MLCFGASLAASQATLETQILVYFLCHRILPFPFKKNLSLKQTETLRLSLKNLSLKQTETLRLSLKKLPFMKQVC